MIVWNDIGTQIITPKGISILIDIDEDGLLIVDYNDELFKFTQDECKRLNEKEGN